MDYATYLREQWRDAEAALPYYIFAGIVVIVVGLYYVCRYADLLNVRTPVSKTALTQAEQWHASGLKAWESGDLQSAETKFRQSINIYPGFAKGMSDLGALLDEMGKQEESIKILKQCVKIEPDAADAWFNLGTAYMAREEWGNAENAFHKSVNADPGDSEGWYNLGIMREKGEDIEGARLAYREGIIHEPADGIKEKLENALARLKG